MASTNVRSKPAHPHNSFAMLESFVEDALVYQPYVSKVRLDAGLNQSRKGLNRRDTDARHLPSIITTSVMYAAVSVIFAEHVSYIALFTVCAFCVLMM